MTTIVWVIIGLALIFDYINGIRESRLITENDGDAVHEVFPPGVVKRVYQAVYAKLLAPEDKVLRPDPKNLTPRSRALFELLFSD